MIENIVRIESLFKSSKLDSRLSRYSLFTVFVFMKFWFNFSVEILVQEASFWYSYNLSQLPGEYIAHYVQPLGATGLINHLYPHRYPFILLGEEKQLQ